MADNDIYDSKVKYEDLKNGKLLTYLEKPSGYRKYQIKNKKNLDYFYKLIQRFEAADLSYIRRLRLLRSFLIVCHYIEKDLVKVDRDSIDNMVGLANENNKAVKTKKDFVKDLKYMWKILFPEKDEKGRIDDTLVPYVVRHLSTKIDKSREKIRKDKFTIEEFEKLVVSFANDSRMQALITLQFESLGRPQELLGRNISDVEIHENYAKVYISEHGKEGVGFLRCIDSFYYLMKWLGEHPLKNNLKAPLFINIGTRNKYKRLKPSGVNKLLREKCRMLNINKPISMYSFKRNGVTLSRLRGDSDVDIQHRARWTSTRQLKTYDLSTQDDAFKLELIKRGIVKSGEKFADIKPTIKKCLFCNYENGIAEKICVNCKRLLDREEIEKIEKKKEEENRTLKEEMLKMQKQVNTLNEKTTTYFLKLIEVIGKDKSKKIAKEVGL